MTPGTVPAHDPALVVDAAPAADAGPGRATRARGWVAIVPVKAGAVAKSRLVGVEGEGLPSREALLLAFSTDVVRALRSVPSVLDVVVVTNAPERLRQIAELGVTVVREPAPPAGGIRESALNAAVRFGATVARAAHRDANLLVMQGDVPAADGPSLRSTIKLAERYERAMVADADGTGTTMLFATAPHEFTSSFGIGSRSAHHRDGHVVLDAPARVRRDVDTIDDLRDALAMGVGPSTSAIIDASIRGGSTTAGRG